MKLAEHVEYLLHHGHRRKELLELGFSKRIITQEIRKLREKRASESKAQNATMVTQAAAASPLVLSPEESASLGLRKLEERLKAVEALAKKVVNLESCLDGTPLLGLKKNFKCECGATGMVAVHIKCTSCGQETEWGWRPEKTPAPK